MNIVTLTNGKKVGNFSSPHDFTFEDGSVLPAVSDAESERLKVTFLESSYPNGDTLLAFDLSQDVHFKMADWILAHDNGLVDVVFVPLPMMTAIKEDYTYDDIRSKPFRCIRINDRVKKLVSITKQCI